VDQAIDVEWISGACFCTRRSVVDEVGLLDDRFFLYFEDNDWCLRIRQAGWRVVYNPSWAVVHLGGGSQPERRGSNLLYYDSLLYFYQKHYHWWQTQILRVAIAVYRRLIAQSGD
jgi:GT2 family glycosyltransferase